MSVAEVCQRDVDIARHNETVLTAAERMRQRTVGCLVVVEGQVPIGIVTDRDLVLRVVAEDRDAGTTTIGQVMTPYPDVVPEENCAGDGMGMMRRQSCRRLPVIDKSGRLCGLLALDDLMLTFAEEFRQVGDVLGGETPQAAAVGG